MALSRASGHEICEAQWPHEATHRQASAQGCALASVDEWETGLLKPDPHVTSGRPATRAVGLLCALSVLLLTPVTVPSRGSSPWRCGGCSSWAAAPTRSPLSPARSPLAVAAPAVSLCVRWPGRRLRLAPCYQGSVVHTVRRLPVATHGQAHPRGTSLNWALSGRRLALLAGAIYLKPAEVTGRVRRPSSSSSSLRRSLSGKRHWRQCTT